MAKCFWDCLKNNLHWIVIAALLAFMISILGQCETYGGELEPSLGAEGGGFGIDLVCVFEGGNATQLLLQSLGWALAAALLAAILVAIACYFGCRAATDAAGAGAGSSGAGLASTTQPPTTCPSAREQLDAALNELNAANARRMAAQQAVDDANRQVQSAKAWLSAALIAIAATAFWNVFAMAAAIAAAVAGYAAVVSTQARLAGAQVTLAIAEAEYNRALGKAQQLQAYVNSLCGTQDVIEAPGSGGVGVGTRATGSGGAGTGTITG